MRSRKKLSMWGALPPYLGGKRRLCPLIFREIDRLLRLWPDIEKLFGRIPERGVRCGESRRTPSLRRIWVGGQFRVPRHVGLLHTTERGRHYGQRHQQPATCIRVAKMCLHSSRIKPLAILGFGSSFFIFISRPGRTRIPTQTRKIITGVKRQANSPPRPLPQKRTGRGVFGVRSTA